MSSEFVLTQGAGQKLEFAVNRNSGSTADIDWLSTGENFKSVMLLANGEAELILKTKPVEPKVEDPIDFMIRVDRSICPTYPDWVEKVFHPELEKIGPVEFDAAKLELWLHEGQKGGKWIKGQKIYEHLKEKKMLEGCLGLSDLLAIQAKGIAFFRQYFAGKVVFGWKSVVRYRRGHLYAPSLCGDGDRVVLDWNWLGRGWDDDDLALRFAS